MRDELKSRAEQAVDLATAAGANDVFATTTRTREVEFTVRDGELEQVKDATSRSLSVSLWVDGRWGSHSTTDLRPDRLRTFIDETVALTRAIHPDPDRQITDPALFEGRSDADLELVDPNVRALTRDERIALCEAQNERLVGQDKVISATSGCSDGHTLSAKASSNGFHGVHEETWLWIGSEVTLQGEGDKRPEAWFWAGSPQRGDVPPPDLVADRALELARARLGAQKGPTLRTTMVVDNRSVGRLLGRLLGPATARSVHQGRSFWAERQGEKVLSELLTVVDDPLRVRGLSSRKYDSEGIAAKPRNIIEGGALAQFYVDTYYGRKLGWEPTGGSSSNRIVKPGDKDLAGLIADAGEGVYVTGWLGGNADQTTGDFSFGIRGHLIENGAIGAPVGEMNVTGNLIELFANLVAVGDDPYPYSSTVAPSLVFDGVQFSGV